MSSYFAKLNLAAVACVGCLLTFGTLSAQDVTIKVENGTARTITVSPAKDVADENAGDDEWKKKPFTGKRAAVDVAILLDTSSSMDGLIGQAQGQLWNIIQEFSNAEKPVKPLCFESPFLSTEIRVCPPARGTFDKLNS